MTPLSQGYRPELDQSRELDSKRGQYYQSLIGVLRWICELGRIDIMVAVCVDAIMPCCFSAGRSLTTSVSPLCLFEASQAVKDGV
jgi:hypothetical protein